MELNRETKELLERIQNWMHNPALFKPMTEAERVAYDKKIEVISLELFALQKLAPEQVEKEYNALTEDKIKAVRSLK